ncbi:MAG: TetR/AcrR family transcriptional regulator [Nocardioides sp.]|uniref:TetR/AcrR family transcriptional regulator n=1 Tax=Nocardioides sp. TaxID=35761 RepID=UPI0039E35DF5
MSREEEILTAATKLFAERSFDGTGVDALAKEAGITGSAIYRYFSSKDEVLAALFDRLIDALLIRVGDPAPDPDEELRHLIGIHVEYVLDNPELTIIWQREQAALTGDHHRRFSRRQRTYIDRWIQALDARYPGHPRDQLAATVRAIHGLISSDTSRPRTVRRIKDLPAQLCAMAEGACTALA